jgi:hypothetical protein
MDTSATSIPPWVTAKLIVNTGSAVFGLAGTWLMARRYAREPVRALFYAMLWPVILLTGGRNRVRDFLKAKIELNRDVPDSPIDMVLGLNLLFLAFLLQLVALYLEAGK